MTPMARAGEMTARPDRPQRAFVRAIAPHSPAAPPRRPRPLRCRYGADPGDSANVTMVSVAITVTYCRPFTA